MPVPGRYCKIWREQYKLDVRCDAIEQRVSILIFFIFVCTKKYFFIKSREVFRAC